MLLVHDLMLLLLDDDSGRQQPVTAMPQLLGGALLVELALGGHVDVVDPEDPARRDAGRHGRLVVREDLAAPADPLLAEALATVRERVGKRPDSVLMPLGKGLRPRVLQDLVGAGLVSEQRRRVLGIVPVRRYPAAAGEYEQRLRDAAVAVLERRARPDDRTAALISLVSAENLLHRVFRAPDRRAARAVARELAEGNWAAASVRRAVQAATSAATAAAVTAATAAATTATLT